ncbi:MAG TPA: hypothetical protein VG651_00815 [Stellaceae bacterium]|nr:hypothetical protein [Stellaceae bacterium]
MPIFGEDRSLRVNTQEDLARLQALTPAEFRRYRYVSGHFTFSDVRQKCSAESLLVSVLRDPVRRLVSEFNYVASWTGHPYHEHFKNARLSEHVYANAAYIRAVQCDWLSAHRNAEAAMQVIRERYALVGTVAGYDAFVAALGRLIGQDVPATRSNVTPGQGLLDLDSRLCETLLDLTLEDRRLIARIAALPDGVFAGEKVAAR